MLFVMPAMIYYKYESVTGTSTLHPILINFSIDLDDNLAKNERLEIMLL